jgi:hypothetical protein
MLLHYLCPLPEQAIDLQHAPTSKVLQGACIEDAISV